MSLIVRGVNIAETDTCTWQGNPVTKILYRGDTVWEHTSVPTYVATIELENPSDPIWSELLINGEVVGGNHITSPFTIETTGSITFERRSGGVPDPASITISINDGNGPARIELEPETSYTHTVTGNVTIYLSRVSGSGVLPELTSGLYLNLGWDAGTEQDFDCDLWIFKLDSNGKLISINDMIYFGNLESSDGDVGILFDNKTGAGEGNDERGWIDYTKISSDVRKIVVAVAIWDAEARYQNFGQITNCYFSATVAESQEEIINYDLAEEFAAETAVIMLEAFRQGAEWSVNTVFDYDKQAVNGVQGLLDMFDTGLSVNDLVKPE